MKKHLWGFTAILIAFVLFSWQGSSWAGEMLSRLETRVLVKGASIHGADGILFDSNDRLYVASTIGREILVMDPMSGQTIERLGTKLGVESPNELVFGADGSLYWTAIMTGVVGRLAPDGTVTTQFVAPGVNPITFADDGRLFVGQFLFGDALYELDPNLISPPRLIVDNIGPFNGMDWGPDGWLYTPLPFQGRVVRINVDATPVTIETVVDGLVFPNAVKFDSQHRFHVTDSFSGMVWRIDTQTGNKELIASLENGIDNLAFDSQDRLFISHNREGFIAQVMPNGEIRKINKSGMIVPGGVAVLPGPDQTDSVYIADVYSLREYDGRSGREKKVEGWVTGISFPFTVSTDGTNLVWSSYLTNMVQVWDPLARKALETHMDFAVPLNAIHFQGDLVVAELGSGSVVRQTSEGRVTLMDGLFVPAGLAATDDDLWVGDWATGIIWQLVADGVPLSTPFPVAKGLSSPEGLAVHPNGNLLVVESEAGRLSSIDLITGAVSTVAEGLDLGVEAIPQVMPPTAFFNGVAVGQQGHIYVTGDNANVLYRFGEGLEGDDLESDDLESDDLEGDDLESDDLESDDLEGDDLEGDD